MGRLIGIILLLLLADTLLAQQPGDLSITLTTTPSETGNGTGVTELVARISNSSAAPFKGTIAIEQPKPYQLLTARNPEVNVAAKGERYLPIKLFAPGNIAARSDYRVNISLQDQNNQLIATGMVMLVVKKVVSTTMVLLQDQLLIDQQNELTVPVQLMNRGNTRQQVTVIVKYPPGFHQKGFFFSRIPIEPFSDTTLYYQASITPEMRRKEAFDLKFTSLYSDGNLIGINNARVAIAKTTHTFHSTAPGNLPYDGTPNSINVMARYINDPQENYQAWGGSSISFGNSRVIYSFDATVWKNGQIKPVLRNTYVAYEYKQAGLMAGNISRNLDINLFGKGVVAYLKKAGHHRIEAGYLEDGYNLLTNQEILSLQKGWSAWVHHEFTNKHLYLKTDVITNTPSYVRVHNQLVTTELGLDRKNNRLQVNIGYGSTTSAANSSESKSGLAGGLIYSGQFGKFRVTSNNYASSGYYPGYRRGATTLSERAEWQYSNKHRLWIGYNYYSFAPQQLPGTLSYAPIARYFSGKSEIGWDANGGKRFASTLGANYSLEGGDYNSISPSGSRISIRSAHLAATLNYSNPSAHYFATLTMEGGGYQTSVKREVQQHLKANLAASYKWFRLTAFYQSGYFQASEVVSYSALPGLYRQWTVNPQVAKGFWKERLKIEAGYAYNGSSRFPKTSVLNCAVRYFISPKFAAVATASSFAYNGMRQNILEAGFTYELVPAYTDILRAGKQLKVFAFHDLNGDGRYNAGDEPAAGQVLLMNNTPFVTNEKGLARYNRLPDTTVSIRIGDGQEWYAHEVHAKSGDTAVLALQKTGKVSGRIAYLEDEYGYDIEQKLSGIVLSLAGKDKTYKARTDERGNFAFYVPAGSYELVLDAGSLSDKVESMQQGQHIEVTTAQPVTLLVKLQAKGRKVNIRKFGGGH